MNHPLDTLLPTSRRIADRYEVIRPLGVGALGVSYLCRDHDLEEVVCLKLAYRHMLIGRRDRRTFDEWLRSMRAVNSPRLAALQRSGSDAEVGTFFVSSIVDGKPLAKVIAEADRTFFASEVRELLAGIQCGLNDLGELGPHGVLHLNNILLTDGEPVLTDAGSYLSVPSRLFVDAHRRQGTHIWLAPEVMRERQDLDGRTDIYSVCAIAAHLLTGRPPGLQQRKELEALHPGLQAALRAGLTDTAEERVASLHALEAALDAAIQMEPEAEEFTERTERSELSIRQEDLVDIYEVDDDQSGAPAQPVATASEVSTRNEVASEGEETGLESVTDRAPLDEQEVSLSHGVLRSMPEPSAQLPQVQRSLTALQWVLLGVIGLGALLASYLIFHGLLTRKPVDAAGTHRTIAKSPKHTGDNLELPGPGADRDVIRAPASLIKPDAGQSDRQPLVAKPLDAGLAQRVIRIDGGGSTSLQVLAEQALEDAQDDEGPAELASPTPSTLEIRPAPEPPAPVEVDEVLAPAQKKVGGRAICSRGMALIPGGPFAAGSNVSAGVRSPGERQPTQVAVGDFCMDRYEYPNYLRSPPRGNFSALQAKAMCEAKGKRLCGEDEWEKACKGPRGQAYAYGPGYVPERCNTVDEGHGAAVAPLKYPKCRAGYRTFAMTGNLSEWVQAKTGFALKGGSYEEGKAASRCAAREPAPASRRRAEYGVRCCADPSYE